MMRRLNVVVFVMGVLFLTSCGSFISIGGKNTEVQASQEAETVIDEAKSYLGTPYRFGGTSRVGIDCSALVHNSFKSIDLELPRVSRDQAKQGHKINVKNVKPGDLLFFNTSGRGVTHVGIVESVKNNEVFFIHASSSRGVMVSSLNNSYWNPRFLYAKRVL